MCGIFGIKISEIQKSHFSLWNGLIKDLFLLSETRGKEATGLGIRVQQELSILKEPQKASCFIHLKAFKDILSKTLLQKGDFSLIGHTRLATNGDPSLLENNHPVFFEGIAVVHNGIICNVETISHDNLIHQIADLDSTLIPLFLKKRIDKGSSIEEALREFYQTLEGDASLALLFEQYNKMVLCTNTGSLYYVTNKEGSLVFASEYGILKRLIKKYPDKKIFHIENIQQLPIGKILEIDLNQPKILSYQKPFLQENPKKSIDSLKRCTKCILPETFPGIHFNSQGVCSICETYVPFQPYGLEALSKLCDQHRGKDSSPDCIIALSGGRDSSYALHFLKKEMNMNPIAYTYDWGMVTDLARRNISRLCSKLGVEHIVISSDIPKKRSYIRKNLLAWLKKPELGMLSLLMAGDKEFFYHYKKIKEDLNINLVFFASNRLEQSGFKSGFCGVTEINTWYTYIPIFQKVKMILFFLKNFILNPYYINQSLFNTFFSFYCSYLLKHDFHTFYDYFASTEEEIMNVLSGEYNWEFARDTKTSWRIGDGTAAFYNFIYYAFVGFTEHDTLLSNKIRCGYIDRNQAIEIVKEVNKPRFESLKIYTDLIGLNGEMIITNLQKKAKYVI